MSAVESFLFDLEPPQKEIAWSLHELILTFPEVSGKLKFKIPFYSRKSWICYLNPIKNNGIELAFTRGNELSNDLGLLDFKNRKQVAGVSYYDVEAINFSLVSETLQEAIILDETVKYAAKRKTK